jgi:hypothetical protein
MDPNVNTSPEALERWQPRPATPDAEADVEPLPVYGSEAERTRPSSTDGPSTGILSPTPSVARSRPPSPSPAMLQVGTPARPYTRLSSPSVSTLHFYLGMSLRMFSV